MKKLLLGSIIVGVAAPSQALVWGFSAPIIDGSQEVPPNSSAAYGSASFTIDDQTFILTGTMTTTGLPYRTQSGGPNVTGAHIHAPAPPGSNAGVIFNLISNAIGGTPIDLPGGVTFYAWSGVLGGNQNQNLADLIAGLGYVNVHSNAFPGGEIRGQIVCTGVVPEPASIMVMTLGVGIAAGRRLRRQR